MKNLFLTLALSLALVGCNKAKEAATAAKNTAANAVDSATQEVKNAAGLGDFSKVKSISLTESTFNWKGTKKVGDSHTGTIKLKAARLNRTPENKLTSAEFTMDMKSIAVTDIQGKMAEKLRGHLSSADFFKTEEFPTANLVLNKFAGNMASGNLTILGKTQPVENIKFAHNDGKITGQLAFDRTKFGIIYGSGNFVKELALDKIINDQITLNFDLKTN